MQTCVRKLLGSECPAYDSGSQALDMFKLMITKMRLQDWSSMGNQWKASRAKHIRSDMHAVVHFGCTASVTPDGALQGATRLPIAPGAIPMRAFLCCILSAEFVSCNAAQVFSVLPVAYVPLSCDVLSAADMEERDGASVPDRQVVTFPIDVARDLIPAVQPYLFPQHDVHGRLIHCSPATAEDAAIAEPYILLPEAEMAAGAEADQEDSVAQSETESATSTTPRDSEEFSSAEHVGDSDASSDLCDSDAVRQVCSTLTMLLGSNFPFSF